MPNLYVVLVLFIGLFIGKKIGVLSGIIIGLILDALFGRDVGITSILLGAVGLAAEFLDRRYSLNISFKRNDFPQRLIPVITFGKPLFCELIS
jgi:rod shape-determining protein MreD